MMKRLMCLVRELFFIFCNNFFYGVNNNYWIFFRLTGCSPFYGKTYDEILQLNKKCNINFDFKEINFSFTDKGTFLLIIMFFKSC